jgi:hypothetical protein
MADRFGSDFVVRLILVTVRCRDEQFRLIRTLAKTLAKPAVGQKQNVKASADASKAGTQSACS